MNDIFNNVDWDAWLFNPGMPPVDVSEMFVFYLPIHCH